MKIRLRQFLLLKQIVLLAVPVIVLLAIVLSFLLSGRQSEKIKSETAPQNKAALNSIPKTRPASPLAKVRVIKPVRVADEPFKGYYPVPVDDAETDDNRNKSAAQSSEAEALCEELAAPIEGAGKAVKEHIQAPAEAKQERLKEKEIKPEEKAGDPSVARSAAPDEGTKLLTERMDEVGLSEADKRRMVQSYLELRKVLPEKEAQKMIMWKIVHEKK
ncbi:MAG: hypothetical protein HZA15_11380 [Nitrospirae bacterium]|nr:hypothetical protein [Nitrospirota bacterium]